MNQICAALAFLGTATLLAATATSASAAESELFSRNVALHEKAVGTYYVQGSVKGQLGTAVATELLVDTGSSYVALSRDTFARVNKAGGAVHLRDIQGAMASGKRLRVPIYQVPELALGEGCVLHNVEVAVMPGGRDILGWSALRQLEPFAMQTEPPRLLYSRCAGSPAVLLTSSTALRVRAASPHRQNQLSLPLHKRMQFA